MVKGSTLVSLGFHNLSAVRNAMHTTLTYLILIMVEMFNALLDQQTASKNNISTGYTHINASLVLY